MQFWLSLRASRRIPRRRDLAPDQRPSSFATTRPTRIILMDGRRMGKILTQYSTDQPEVHEVIAEMRQRHQRIRRPGADRGGLSAAAPPRRLLRQRSDRRADAVQFCTVVDAVERAVRSKIIHEYEQALPPGGTGRTGCSAITTGRG